MNFDEFQERKPGEDGMGDDDPMVVGGNSDDFGFGDDAPADDFGFDDRPAQSEGDSDDFGMDSEMGEPGGFGEGPMEYAVPSGDTSFFGFFKKGLQIAMLKGDAAEEVANDPNSFVPALVIYLLPSVLGGILMLVAASFFTNALMAGEAAELPPQAAMAMAVLQKASFGLVVLPPLAALIGSLIWVGLLFVFARLLKGTGSFLDYYQTLGVGSLISWGAVIPYIGMLFSLWMLPVSVVVTSRVHRLSIGRSVAVVLLPLVIFVVLLFGLFSALFMAFMGGGAGGMQPM